MREVGIQVEFRVDLSLVRNILPDLGRDLDGRIAGLGPDPLQVSPLGVPIAAEKKTTIFRVTGVQ
jgi:hypothetical protein